MAVRHELTVRFNEVDRAGIAFFGRVFEYCHEAFEELLVAGGSSLAAVFDEEGWGMPLVHADADYSKPLRLSERIAVSVEVERLGRTSLTLAFEVRGATEADLRARVRHVHAFVDMERFEPIPVPTLMIDVLRGAGLLEEQASGG